MDAEALTRRRVLQTAALAAGGLAMPQLGRAGAAEPVAPHGRMVLGWHTNIAPRWLDPLQHDGGATGDNFLNIVQDALIKNYRDKLYDHLALAERFELPRMPRAPRSGSVTTSISTTAHRSRPMMSNGATNIITAAGRRCYTNAPTVSTSSTSAPFVSISRHRSSISRA